MQAGITSYAYPWSIGIPGQGVPEEPLDVPGLITLAAESGSEVVQIADNIDLLSIPEKAWSNHQAMARDCGIKLELGGRGLTGENLSEHLKLCDKLDIRMLRFVIDSPGYEPPLKEVASLLSSMLPEIRAMGVTLAIENHDRFRSCDLSAVMECIADDNVGICLDTANSLGSGEGMTEVLEHLAAHTVNLHLKDVHISRLPHMLGFTVEGVPLGKGVVDVSETLRKILPYGRCSSALVELWPPPGVDLQATIQTEKRWVKESMAFLHGTLDRLKG